MFYEFNQNNSGGSFNFDKKNGITHIVIIEAKTAEEANTKAEEIGIYFNGCNDGRDCSCCGDRWCEVNEPGTKSALIYGKSPKKYVSKGGQTLWMKKGFEICIHYKNNKKEWF